MKTVIINSKTIDINDIKKGKLDLKDFNRFEREVHKVLKAWHSNQDSFNLYTSGSTSSPKKVSFSRSKLKKSAKRTIDYFHLKPGDRIFMCLNPKFVAGFMMLIRALEGDLDLVIQTPSLNPLKSLNDDLSFQFASFTPGQADSIMENAPQKFENIEKILIGGVSINPQLEKKLRSLRSQVFHSYGMTETLTHVAIRAVSGNETSNVFQALNGVTFGIEDRSCLIIHDKVLNIRNLVTNDIVELLNEKSFIWQGRVDNVVNSGGIKIHLEQLEAEIDQILLEMGMKLNFCLIPQEDQKLTNRIVLLLENRDQEIDKEFLLKTLKSKLPAHHDPKKILQIPKIALTTSGKVDRMENIRLYLRG